MLIESTTSHASGEFGEFHPAAPDSREEISLLVVTTEPSELVDQLWADVQVSTDEENYIHLEMPMEHVIREVIEARPEAWRQAHLVCRNDRQHGNVVSLRAQVLDASVPYVETYTGFGSEAEQDYDAASL
jgi:hypothetical protein